MSKIDCSGVCIKRRAFLFFAPVFFFREKQSAILEKGGWKTCEIYRKACERSILLRHFRKHFIFTSLFAPIFCFFSLQFTSFSRRRCIIFLSFIRHLLQHLYGARYPQAVFIFVSGQLICCFVFCFLFFFLRPVANQASKEVSSTAKLTKNKLKIDPIRMLQSIIIIISFGEEMRLFAISTFYKKYPNL
jgi:hypothetical protein